MGAVRLPKILALTIVGVVSVQLLRSIDLMTEARDKALVWQTGVISETSTGNSSGAVVVSGLKLLVNTFEVAHAVEYPEAAIIVLYII